MLSLDWLHAMVSYLLPPALWALLLACAVAVFDLAVALGERLRGRFTQAMVCPCAALQSTPTCR